MAIPAPKKPELTPKKRKRIAGVAIAAGVGLFLVVSLLSGNLSRSGGSKVSKLIVGKHDAIYYSPPVTKADAMALESKAARPAP